MSSESSGSRRRRSSPRNRPTPPRRVDTRSTPPPMALAIEGPPDIEREPAPPVAAAVDYLSPPELLVAVQNTLTEPSNQELAEALGTGAAEFNEFLDRYGCLAADILDVFSARALQFVVSPESERRLNRLKRSLRKASRALSSSCSRTRRRGVFRRARSAVARGITRRARRG